jgi:hypothetical protein
LLLPLCTPGELRPLLLPQDGLPPLLLPPVLPFMRCASALTPMISCLLRAFSSVWVAMAVTHVKINDQLVLKLLS